MISRLLRNLTFQVLVAVSLGILLGVVAPDTAKSLKPLGDTFINLVKMVITPIIFLTIVHGIASMADLRKLGRVGGKALLYFELVSTLALAIGLIIVNVTKPGAGLDISKMAMGDVSKYTSAGAQQSTLEFMLHIVPSNVVAAFASGELLPVVFFSVLFGIALTAVGDAGREIADLLVRFQAVFFKIVSMVMVLAPIGAFGAMAYTVGAFGLKTLVPLARLMLDVYLTMAIFVFVVLGLICRAYGFRIWKFIRFIKEEILLVLGTSSSETALPGMMEKSIKLGCSPSTVGLVIPSGYSFNLDGTNIYLCMAAVFLAQATNTQLDLGQQITLLLVAMISSKGSSGVTGAGFITLAATLATVPSIPIESLSLLIGIDRFMSECRAITNLIGNGVATVVISRWEGELTKEQLNECLQK